MLLTRVGEETYVVFWKVAGIDLRHNDVRTPTIIMLDNGGYLTSDWSPERVAKVLEEESLKADRKLHGEIHEELEDMLTPCEEEPATQEGEDGCTT